jgi:hypothetical protein
MLLPPLSPLPLVCARSRWRWSTRVFDIRTIYMGDSDVDVDVSTRVVTCVMRHVATSRALSWIDETGSVAVRTGRGLTTAWTRVA